VRSISTITRFADIIAGIAHKAGQKIVHALKHTGHGLAQSPGILIKEHETIVATLEKVNQKHSDFLDGLTLNKGPAIWEK
jgi:hypothetical protein